MQRRALTLITLAVVLAAAVPAGAYDLTRIFFLHNSVGRALIDQGSMREHLDEYNTAHGTNLRFWDHNYPYIGLRDAEGEYLEYPYSSVCGHNNDPDGLAMLWLEENIPQYAAARDSILTEHDVIAFKSCYRAMDFGGALTPAELDAALQQYKNYYLQMRDVFDQHQDKVFVVISIPPRHRLHAEATPGRAARGRQFANWLCSSEFLGNPPRPNVRAFDLFNLLAAPNNGQPGANMLRYDFEISHTDDNCHPNQLACSIVGPIMMQALIDASHLVPTSVDQVPLPIDLSLQAQPNPFNPLTTLSFELPQAMPVTLEILDLRGRRVRLLANESLTGGWHRYQWNGRDASGQLVGSGIFLGRLQAGEQQTVRLLTLIK